MTRVAIKRLRFAYDPADDESVCGAFTAACHDQRLRTVRSALEGAGLSLPRPAHLQFADKPTLAAAAAAMRIDAARLQAIAFTPGFRRDAITLGDLALPRSVVDLERRRIGPRSLTDEPWHRAEWLNRLLPYCPKSLEVLVEACARCGPLGWRFTRGIESCEGCGHPVPASAEPPLQPGLADAYRAVADLLSRNEKRGAAAMTRMPASLAAHGRTAVANLLIRVALVTQRSHCARAVDALVQQPASVTAAAICLAYDLVTGWPGSMQAFAEQLTGAMGDDIKAYERLRADLKWIASASSEVAAILALAFPKIDGRTADTFAKGHRYYTASQTNTILRTVSKELALLRDARAVRFEKLPSKVRLRARYDADDIDALRGILDSVTEPEAGASDLDLPTYAMEQLADVKLLEIRDEPGVVALRGPQLVAATVRSLIDRIRRQGIRSDAPRGHVRLRTALSGLPGEKPWGAALKAILDEGIPFYIGDDVSVRRLAIDPARLPDLPRPSIAPGRLRIIHLSLRDAMEVLACKNGEGAATIRSGAGAPVAHGYGFGFARTDIAKLVAQVAFTGEAAVNSKKNGIKLHHVFTSIGVPRVHGAWSREALVELGMVRSFTFDEDDPDLRD